LGTQFLRTKHELSFNVWRRILFKFWRDDEYRDEQLGFTYFAYAHENYSNFQ